MKTQEMSVLLISLIPNVGTGMVGAPACGDVMKLQIKVDNDV
jgi:NifU-like protein involved in Fe-S cluster formation